MEDEIIMDYIAEKTGTNPEDIKNYFIFKDLEKTMSNHVVEIGGLEEILPSEIVDSYHRICSAIGTMENPNQKKSYRPKSLYPAEFAAQISENFI